VLFNSAIFLVLFVIVYLLYWNISARNKQRLIIFASLLFYAWYSIPFLLLFLVLVTLNYLASIALLERKAKSILLAILTLDLAVLGFFKYFYLIAESAGELAGSAYLTGIRANLKNDYDITIVLPIAISFYTFQMIAYVVDSYRSTVAEKTTPGRFFLFILFFPQFIAGPIMRASDFMDQIDKPQIDRDRVINGSLLLLMGAVKKVLVADRLGVLSGAAWIRPSEYDATALLLILPLFVLRIYCDFSGYTDMARGMAKLLGYEIPENFAGPLLAKSMAELWQRWHITLSTWLRDYIYIPLGGSRLGETRTSLNILIALGLGGLWHGASWTMLFWGVFIGAFLVAERFMGRRNIRLLPEKAWANALRILFVFSCFSFSAIFFNSPGLKQTLEILQGIAAWQRGLPLPEFDAAVALGLLAFSFNFIQYGSGFRSWLAGRPRLRLALLYFLTPLVAFLIFLFGDVAGSFIYFQF
jgi:D-alanyl-lipoteichoic acid acyltransferase DltB (MBOAT superfamily)